ncbi:hypothetical protein [Acaryochloris marina]|uniref:hypothetical protein n=1 Tax=Acaryochloris marina TaxID=155978 RepID=UPI001BB01566|nr:hypothetical protein [Acaryochloris marina]QUY46029.1 hypothetical protein I1H34_30380 [Acaryochloris marina S15]
MKSNYAKAIVTVLLTGLLLLLLTACQQSMKSSLEQFPAQSNAQTNASPASESECLNSPPRWRGRQRRQNYGQYSRLYNPSTVETLQGQVIQVDTVTPRWGMSTGVHLQLRTEEGNVEISLGPTWYFEDQNFIIQQGNKITLTGSRVEVDSQPAVIAAAVTKADVTLKLRDQAGIPIWRNWGGCP